MTQEPPNALILVNGEYQTALSNALRLWAEAVTSTAIHRREELLRYKQKVVDAFFAFTGKHPAEVSPLDVEQ